jgi:transposase
MAWGAISHNWKSPLVILEGKGKRGVIAEDYLKQVLEPIVSPAFMGILDYNTSLGGQYVEDQAPIHGTRRSLVEAKAKLAIPLHHRPPCSPDLNPIENVWRIMKSRIKARTRFPATIAEMKEAVQVEWDRLEPDDWNGLIESMPNRIRQCIERRGMQTEY